MADDSTAQMVDLSLVAEIVRSYVAQNSVGVDQVAELIATVSSDRETPGSSSLRRAARPRAVPLETARRSSGQSLFPDQV